MDELGAAAPEKLLLPENRIGTIDDLCMSDKFKKKGGTIHPPFNYSWYY